MKNKIILAIWYVITLTFNGTVFADIFKYVDPNGHSYYTDCPGADGRDFELIIGTKNIDWQEHYNDLSKKAMKGSAKAAEELGCITRHDYTKAFYWLEKAAEKNLIKSQHNVAYMLYQGLGVPKDYIKSFRWFKLAAENGKYTTYMGNYGITAQDYLGYMYSYGQGVEQNYIEAIKWYKKAADNGSEYSQDNLGLMYQDGKGVQQDYSEAIKLFRTAADRKYPSAQTHLGQMYENGKGVPQDHKEAIRWYQLAADQGEEYAKNRLKDLSVTEKSTDSVPLLTTNSTKSSSANAPDITLISKVIIGFVSLLFARRFLHLKRTTDSDVGNVSNQKTFSFFSSSVFGIFGIVFLIYMFAQLDASYEGIAHYWGNGWAIGILIGSFVVRSVLPITIGAFYGAMEVWGWSWYGSLLFAVPGLALVIPSVLALILGSFKRSD